MNHQYDSHYLWSRRMHVLLANHEKMVEFGSGNQFRAIMSVCPSRQESAANSALVVHPHVGTTGATAKSQCWDYSPGRSCRAKSIASPFKSPLLWWKGWFRENWWERVWHLSRVTGAGAAEMLLSIQDGFNKRRWIAVCEAKTGLSLIAENFWHEIHVSSDLFQALSLSCNQIGIPKGEYSFNFKTQITEYI